MLIVLLLIPWLAIMGFFVAICRMAARGDAARGDTASAAPAEQDHPVAIGGVVVWSDPPDVAPRENRVHRSQGRITAHGAR